ncbi:MAG: GDP-mannose 4,6-dehydratase [Firmicutes bacterium]|nr:GDP-mannose 4,6-dehydratase [Bacillota bacterium]
MNLFWKNKNVFVTGGTGFLGSYLVKKLAELGANVTVLVRDGIPKSNLYAGNQCNKINYVYGDLVDYNAMERAITEYEIDTVFHVAAQAIVGVANQNPLSTFGSNIGGTWNILEACRRNPRVKRIIVASSDKAYGEQMQLPYNENMPLQGKHPYDVSKSCADLLAQSYFATYSLPVAITRCGNLYGGGDLNYNRIIPGTIMSVLNEIAPIIRSNGNFIRDYFYVEDAVEAYMTLAEKMEELKLAGEAFNFGNEQPLSVNEVVALILDIMKSNLKPVVLNQGANEIENQYLDVSKAHKVLSWLPKHNIKEGIEKTVNWYRNN